MYGRIIKKIYLLIITTKKRMPQVFKSRRNILRAANKSKREHFTQETDYQTLVDHITELNQKLENLRKWKGKFKEFLEENPDLNNNTILKLEKSGIGEALKGTIGNIIKFIDTLVDTYGISGVGSLPTETDQDLLDSAEEMIKTVKNILIVLNNEKEKVEDQNKTLEPVAVLPELQPDDQQPDVEPENDELPAPASNKTFQEQWGSVVGSEGIKTCKQLNNARKQIFGLDSVKCESFQQAPKEFPNSKKKKDEDFTQDFEVLMSQLESKIDTLIDATGSTGSYVTKRNEQLGSLKSIIGSEIEGDTAFIGSMSDSLKATGSMISARIVQLKDLKSDFDRISGSEVWEE